MSAACARAWLGVLSLVGLLNLLPPPAVAAMAQVAIVDDGGAQVRLAMPPQRIVSLLPSLTESVCALGACGALVGTDRWSNWPERVKALPKLGGLDDVSVEALLALRPELVLVAPSSRLAGRLRGLGLVVAELDAQDLPGVQRMLTQVATLLGRPELAKALWQGLQQEVVQARSALAPSALGRRVYVEVSSAPYAAGESSFIGQLLSHLGARNVVPASLGPFPKLNPEFVLRARPEVVVLAAPEVAAMLRRPGWSALPAVQQGRVCGLSAGDHDLISRPGPRLGLAAHVLARCLEMRP